MCSTSSVFFPLAPCTVCCCRQRTSIVWTRKNIQAYSKSWHLADALNHTQNLKHFFAAGWKNMDFTCMSRDISVWSRNSHASGGRTRSEQRETSTRTAFYCSGTQAATFDSTNIQQLRVFVYACVRFECINQGNGMKWLVWRVFFIEK